MKYFLLIILLSCSNKSKKVIISAAESDTVSPVAGKPDTPTIDIHDPYETGKDTVRLNATMNRIFKFPEVQAIHQQIIKASKGADGVSFMVQDKFGNDTSYYIFMVGDNSREERYINSLNFLLEKKTGQIKAYDPVLDTILSLRDWRKTRK